jgi:hypothetical protein
MAITQAMCTSFKQELLTGTHNFTTGQDTIKLALYTSSASLDASTTAYSTSNEASGTGYSAGGNTLTNITPTTGGTTAFTDFNDTDFTSSSITARGALIYNSSQSDKAICVLDFGSDKTSSNGTFSIVFPNAAASTAIIRIA